MERTLLQTRTGESKGGHRYTVNFWAGEVAQVSILSWPVNALDTLARSTRGYLGNYSQEGVTDEERALFSEEIKKTALATPVEFLNFVFLVRDVPRSFTHQIVRTRIGAAYVQESTRFIGARETYDVLVPKTAHLKGEVDGDYLQSILQGLHHYENVVEKPGIHTQDARQLLPHAVLTHLFWSINMKALQVVYNQRWCCAAEPSTWIPVMRQTKQLVIQSCGEEIGGLLTAPVDRGQSCGFNSKVLDRECFWRPRPAELTVEGHNG